MGLLAGNNKLCFAETFKSFQLLYEPSETKSKKISKCSVELS